MYAYIDESGDSGYSKNSSKYHILVCVIFPEESSAPRIAKTIFKKFNLGKLKKNHLHATDENDKVRIKTLAEIKKYKFEVVYEKIAKNEVHKDYYEELFTNLMQKINSKNIFKCFVSMKDNRKNTLVKLNDIAKRNNIRIIFAKPEKEKGLQIADSISWFIYQHYEKNRSEYYELLLQK